MNLLIMSGSTFLIVATSIYALLGIFFLLARLPWLNSIEFDLQGQLISALALLNVFGFWCAWFGLEMEQILKALFYLGILGAVFLLIKIGVTASVLGLQTILLSTLIGLWVYLPGLFQLSQNSKKLGVIIHGNNDIVNYGILSQSYMNSGFRETGHLVGSEVNRAILTGNYQTPTLLIAFIASGFNLLAWQALIPSMVFAIGFSVMAVFKLIEVIGVRVSLSLKVGIAMIVTSGSLASYVVLQYWLGQVFATGVAIFLLASFIELHNEGGVTKLQLIKIASLVILSLYTYPSFLIPFIVLGIFAFIIVTLIFKGNVREILISKVSLAVLIGVVASIPCAWFGIKLSLSQGAQITNWPLPILNPASILIRPELINHEVGNIFTIVSWIVLVLIFFYSFGPATKNIKALKALFLYTVLILSTLVFAVIIRGKDVYSYENWKIFSYFSPILVLGIATAVVSSRGKLAWTIFVAWGITLLAPITIWNTNIPDGFKSTPDLIELSNNPRIEQLSELNIALKPYFETMLAISMINHPKIYPNSENYWSSTYNPKACTLLELPAPHFKFVIPINATYGLGSNDPAACQS
jgi:hypothetical protein